MSIANQMNRIGTENKQGVGAALGRAKLACVSNSFPIKLVRNSENTSLIRYAAYPAFRALYADCLQWGGVS
ncbi:hypothetical protein EBU02_11390 [bacterium]|nr:hypothetical protein [bacterium]